MTDIEDFVKECYTLGKYKSGRGYKKSDLVKTYRDLVARGELSENIVFRNQITKKLSKAHSGIFSITVLTSPGEFSCKMDCHYCPNEPGYPRSYLSKEPAVMRGKENEFHPIKQMYSRLNTLYSMGHSDLDKLEILILGGTWSFYPIQYQEWFITSLYYAANCFRREQREMYNLLEEQTENEITTNCHIIGITLETRPDQITYDEIQRFNRYGCTRVQLGIQHTNDYILKKINRKCTQKQNLEGIRLLKEAGFKVDIHLMPDLPGSNPEMDKQMMLSMMKYCDYLKIYPTSVTPYTKIEQWYNEGKYKPYAEDGTKLEEMLCEVLPHIPQYVRLNRMPRDIPTTQIIGGNNQPHLRCVVTRMLTERGIKCKDIRTREVGNRPYNNIRMRIIPYYISGGLELFIHYKGTSLDNREPVLLGLCRLRLSKKAYIRELHVYGNVIKVGDQRSETQNKGLGRKMVNCAEWIAWLSGYTRVEIISGVGVRGFYRRLGYKLDNYYMVREFYSILWIIGIIGIIGLFFFL